MPGCTARLSEVATLEGGGKKILSLFQDCKAVLLVTEGRCYCSTHPLSLPQSLPPRGICGGEQPWPYCLVQCGSWHWFLPRAVGRNETSLTMQI